MADDDHPTSAGTTRPSVQLVRRRLSHTLPPLLKPHLAHIREPLGHAAPHLGHVAAMILTIFPPLPLSQDMLSELDGHIASGGLPAKPAAVSQYKGNMGSLLEFLAPH